MDSLPWCPQPNVQKRKQCYQNHLSVSFLFLQKKKNNLERKKIKKTLTDNLIPFTQKKNGHSPLTLLDQSGWGGNLRLASLSLSLLQPTSSSFARRSGVHEKEREEEERNKEICAPLLLPLQTEILCMKKNKRTSKKRTFSMGNRHQCLF